MGHKWWGDVIHNIIYFYHNRMQVSLMNGLFFTFKDQVLKITCLFIIYYS